MKRRGERGEWTGSRGAFLVECHTADAMASAHWHDHLEINLLLEGQMTYLFNGRQEVVEAGRMVLFWAAIPHQTILVSDNAPLVCAYLPLVDFLALPIDKDARRLIMQGRFLADQLSDGSDAIAFPRWEREWQNADAVRQRLIVDEVKVRIRRLILDNTDAATSTRHTVGTTTKGHAVRHVEILSDLINSQFSNAVSVPDLTKIAGMHETTANRAFRDVLGMSVNEYLTRYRIARAMQLLTDTDRSVLQIAFDCGFGSSSRFYETFKERTGTTPRQFRISMTPISPSDRLSNVRARSF